MTAILMKRTLSGLTPDDDAATDLLRRLPVGDVVKVEVQRPRSHKALRKWWALCNLVHQNCDQFKSPEQVHDWLKIKAGHCSHIVSKATGEVFLIADSIAFSRLTEDEFANVWQRAIKAICEDVLPGLSDHEIEYEIASIIGLAGGRK
jgi:hypothetical protein